MTAMDPRLSPTIAMLIERETARRVIDGADPESARRAAVGCVEEWMQRVHMVREHWMEVSASSVLKAVARRAGLKVRYE